MIVDVKLIWDGELESQVFGGSIEVECGIESNLLIGKNISCFGRGKL